ncbi:MAG: hypothetical protein R2705_01190 [Ilumatobacteraceae bacterium]
MSTTVRGLDTPSGASAARAEPTAEMNGAMGSIPYRLRTSGNSEFVTDRRISAWPRPSATSA